MRANGVRNPFEPGIKRMAGLSGDLSGARSPAVVEAAKVLRVEIRKQVRARGAPSGPGRPPRRQTGKLWRSIRYGVVDGTMRVGSSLFTAPLLEYGTLTGAPGGNVVGRASARKARRRTASSGRQGKALAPRPFMRAALEAALPKMGEASVAGLRRWQKVALPGDA